MTQQDAAVCELGYIELGVSDRDAWQNYATTVLGIAAETSDGALLLKIDDGLWRIRIEQSGEDDIRCAGFRVNNEATLEAISTRLSNMGVSVIDADQTEASERGVDLLRYCDDPSGMRVELYVGARADGGSFESPQGVSGFVTGEQGLGHIVLFVDDEQAAVQFYQQGLGFLLSDHITMGPPGREFTLTFLHCNPRHHTLALAPIPVPRKLNHIMLQVSSLNDVGHGLDRATDAQTPISSSLGCHTNDRMVSFYMSTPSGFDIEYGYGGVEIDDRTWETATYNSPSIWGHKGALN